MEIADLRDQVRVFRGRDHAGRVVAGLLESFRGTDTTILAIPSGGVPVGVAMAEQLDLPLEVAVEAVRRLKAWEIVIAVPTGSADRVRRVAREVDALYCANIRGGWGFAVAEAYQRWFDLEEEEAVRIVQAYQQKHHPGGNEAP